MNSDKFPTDITFSDTMMMDPTTVFTLIPTLDDIDLDRYPDPDGYMEGQEEYVYDDDDYAQDGDMYEPDFAYNE
jgi:hypothetical protein